LFYAAVAQSQHIRDYADTTQPVGSLTPVADAFEADSPGGFTKGALHSPLGYSFYFRVADTAPGDAGMDSAGGSVAMRTSSLKFQAAGDREYGFWPPCRVFLVHIGKEAIFLSIKPTPLVTITSALLLAGNVVPRITCKGYFLSSFWPVCDR